MRLRIFTFVILIILGSCSMPDRFDREIWLSNSDMTDTRNPRARMTDDDLLTNYLKPGMRREEILTLLGEPSLEQIENRLPKGLEIPDSLSLGDSVNVASLLDSVTIKHGDKELEKFNEWYRKNSQLDTLMLYPVGWLTIDPKFSD